MINKTVLRMISRFRDLLELVKTELFESGKLSVHRR